MKIIRIFVTGFKSLNSFDLRLDKFNCLIGGNGVGKSTILQLLDFVSAIVSNTVYQWLDDRGLGSEDIASNLHPKKRVIVISILYEYPTVGNNSNIYLWSVSLSRGGVSLRSEELEIFDYSSSFKGFRKVFEFKQGEYSFYGEDFLPSPFVLSGSAISALPRSKLSSFLPDDKIEDFSFHLKAFDSLRDIKSFDMLTPSLLRKTQKKDVDVTDIGLGGEYLGVFINNLTVEQKAQLVEDVRKIYPHVVGIQTKVRKFGWVELSINESVAVDVNGDEYRSTLNHKSKVLNDGVLRVIAILAQKYTRSSVILFDEIENGVNSEIVQKVIDSLRLLDKQVVVTTHSPVVLNYIPESEAKRSVHLIYRGRDGATKETLFFDIPSVKEKLDFLAPGYAMLDVYLEKVSAEADKARKEKEWKSELKKEAEVVVGDGGAKSDK